VKMFSGRTLGMVLGGAGGLVGAGLIARAVRGRCRWAHPVPDDRAERRPFLMVVPEPRSPESSAPPFSTIFEAGGGAG
jgi:hypothetical protein